MGVAISRMDVINNQTGAVIEIREVREGDGDSLGCYGYTIKLQPEERKEVSATKFSTRSELCGRASFLKIFVNGKQTDASLSPQDFIEFSRIVFRHRAGARQFTISGIRANLSDLRRIRWLGCVGRDYEGREEKTIATGSFPVCDASTMTMKPNGHLRDSVTAG